MCTSTRITLFLLVLTFALPATAQTSEDATGPFGLMNHHADPDVAINADNVSQLQQAWHVETDGYVSHVPLVDSNRVYFADWEGNVYRVALDSGRVVWKKKIHEPNKAWPWHGFAGTGLLVPDVEGGDLLIEASVEGVAYGVDAETGEVRWERRFVEDPQAGNTSRPLYWDGLVYLGVQSVEEPLSKGKKDFEPDFRGRVLALDPATGETAWETVLVEPPHNGASVWSSFALDPDLGLLYFTTGNNYTGESTANTDAVIAVEAKTGEIRWVRQTFEDDIWTPDQPLGPDYDFGAGPQLFEAEIDGQTRRLVGAGQKSGIYWTYDRETGEPVWNHVVSYGSKGGGIHAEAAIGDSTLYLWGNNSYNYSEPPEDHPVDITAVDVATGERRWAHPKAHPAGITSAGFLAGDVYLAGSLDGKVRAYRAADGERVWTSEQHGEIASGLNVVRDMLLFGTGVPKPFGQREGQGVVAYRLGQ
ncbi:MAG: PQQ-binding-like beta-propeller repeat protein [Rhodothermales bacterium]